MKQIWPQSLNKLSAGHLYELNVQLRPEFIKLLELENIPVSTGILDNFSTVYLPFAAWLASCHQDKPVTIGINGAQGSGKSTLSLILSRLLQSGFNKNVATLSIDDLYKTQQQRQDMALNIHPLFATRGVPGTHDIDIGLELVTRLKQAQKGDEIAIPKFNKATDDRYDKSHWDKINAPVDIILFEGWCVGATPQDEELLNTAINKLEETEDIGGQWRHFVNTQLAGPYQDLFASIDILVMLTIPDFKYVYQWRQQQEQKQLAMTDLELERFIMHFERITRACLDEMPERADILLTINKQHQISNVISKD